MYKKLAIVTIAAVYFLIAVGGIVRASGSGMGCPDWPKCFGMWMPPTNVDQLPLDYQKVFGAKLKGEVEFNVFKTWTEYINRLVGVLIGVLIFATLILAWQNFWIKNKPVVLYSLLAFLLVGAEGYLGSKVVSTELNPGLITIHMLLAIAVVLCLIYALYLSNYSEDKQILRANESLRYFIMILMILTIGQLILGTQIREVVDILSSQLVPREEWLTVIKSGQFYTHVALGILVLIGHLVFYKAARNVGSLKYLKILLIVVISEFVIGGFLGIMNVSAIAQPFHLTLATLIIGLQFGLLLIYGKPFKAIR